MNNLINSNSSNKRNLTNSIISPRGNSVKYTKTSTSKFDDSSILTQSRIEQSDNLRVVIRIRPPLPRELEEGLPFRSIV